MKIDPFWFFLIGIHAALVLLIFCLSHCVKRYLARKYYDRTEVSRNFVPHLINNGLA